MLKCNCGGVRGVWAQLDAAGRGGIGRCVYAHACHTTSVGASPSFADVGPWWGLGTGQTYNGKKWGMTAVSTRCCMLSKS